MGKSLQKHFFNISNKRNHKGQALFKNKQKRKKKNHQEKQEGKSGYVAHCTTCTTKAL